jgi:hypothetical protein
MCCPSHNKRKNTIGKKNGMPVSVFNVLLTTTSTLMTKVMSCSSWDVTKFNLPISFVEVCSFITEFVQYSVCNVNVLKKVSNNYGALC